MPISEKAIAMPAIPRVERDRQEAKLDEALGETFPASDPVAITPVRRVAGEDDAVVPDTATGTSSVADAVRNSQRRPNHEGDRP